MRILVTGANGFVGRNLCAALSARKDVQFSAFDVGMPRERLFSALGEAEIVFHLAGVNRPKEVDEYRVGNAELTREICTWLREHGRRTKIVLTSSIQVELGNPYGESKRQAEEALSEYAAATGASAVVYRLKNLFGKWCRPNYNSVTATFCHNIARDLPIEVSNPASQVELTYIDDVMAAFLGELADSRPGYRLAEPLPSERVTVGGLLTLIRSFRESRANLLLPDFSRPFVRALYATYLSYLPPGGFAYCLEQKSDPRGVLAEFIKQPSMGQIFVSRTKPGITRGNHFHHTKVEKFMVLEGQARVRFRSIQGEEVLEYPVEGREFKVVDIPPGYTHSIENVGQDELVTLFWSSQIFDPVQPDTRFLQVNGVEKLQ